MKSRGWGNSILLVALVWCGICASVGRAHAQVWTKTSAPNTIYSFFSTAMSADGRVVVGAGHLISSSGFRGPIYISTNWGNTWRITSDFTNYWTCVACSADGSTQYASAQSDLGQGLIYTSTNFGATWNPTGILFKQWKSVCCSADGVKVAATATSAGIFISTNSGNTWDQSDAPHIFSWGSLAGSADGNKLLAAAGNSIWTSSDAGANWITNYVDTPYPDFGLAASSVDGSHLQIAEPSTPPSTGPIFSSSDYGATWVQANAPIESWTSIASSADGSKLIATCDRTIYTSTNYGVSWVSNNVPATVWSGAACSPDGFRMFAWAAQSGLYIWQATPTPSLDITSTNGNFMLSWLAPSTNFILQESSDLVSWTAVTNTPLLNLTNLQYQVELSPSPGSGFYRLASP